MVSGSYSSDYRIYSPIDQEAFYRTLKEAIESGLLDSKNADLTASAYVLDRKHWPEDIDSQLTLSENEVIKLSIKLQLNERDTIRGLQEFLIEKTVVEKLKHLKGALSMIPISSSVCERGFSQMCLIISPTRASLMTKTISSLLFLKIVRPPLTCFDPAIYVDSWLLQKRH
jgi:hypothetical protein